MALTAASLMIDVGADTSQADRALAALPGKMRNVADAANQTGISLDSMFNVAGGQMFAQVISNTISQVWSLGQTALQSYAFSERLGASMEAMISREMVHNGVAGSVTELRMLPEAMAEVQGRAQELQQWMERFAIQSPFSYADIADGFRMAQTYGFAADQAKRVTEAVANFASGSGQSGVAVQRVTMALGQMRTVGKVLTQDLRQMTNVGVDVYGALSRAFGKPTSEIMMLIQKGLLPANEAIEAIVSSLEEDFGSAAKAQAGTVTGLLSSMGDLVPMRARDLFAGTFREVQPFLDKMVSGLTGEDSIAAIKKFGDAIGRDVGEALREITGLVGEFQSAFAAAGNAVQGVSNGMAAVLRLPSWLTELGLFVAGWATLTPVIAGVGTKFMQVIAPIGPALRALTSPIGLLAAAVTGLYFAWDTNFGGMQDIIKALGVTWNLFTGLVNGTQYDINSLTNIYNAIQRAFGDETTQSIMLFTENAAGAFVVLRDALTIGEITADSYALAINFMGKNAATDMATMALGIHNALSLVSDTFLLGIPPEEAYFGVMNAFGTEAANKLLNFAIQARQAFATVVQALRTAQVQVAQIANAFWIAFTDPGKALSMLDLYSRLGIDTLAQQALATAVNFRTTLITTFNQVVSAVQRAGVDIRAAFAGDWAPLLTDARSVFAGLQTVALSAVQGLGGLLVVAWNSIWNQLRVTLAGFGIDLDGTIANVVGILTAFGGQVTTAIQPVVAVLTPMWERLTSAFSTLPARLQVLNPLLTQMGAAFGRLGASTLPFLQVLGTIAAGVLTIIADLAGNFAAGFLENLPTMLTALIGVFTVLANGLSNVYDSIVQIFTALQTGDWGAVVSGIGGVIYNLIDMFFGSMGKMGVMAGALWSTIGGAIINTLDDIGILDYVIGLGNGLRATWGRVVAFFTTTLPASFRNLQVSWGQLWTRIQAALAPVLGAIQRTLQGIQAAFARGWASIQSWGAGVMVVLGPLANTVGQALQGMWNAIQAFNWAAAWDIIVTTAQGIGTQIQAAVGGWWTWVQTGFGTLVATIVAFDWGAAWNTAVETAKGIGSDIQSAVGTWWDSVVRGWNVTVNSVRTYDWGGAWTTVTTKLGEVGVTIQTAIEGWQPYAEAGWAKIKEVVKGFGDAFGVDLSTSLKTLEDNWIETWKVISGSETGTIADAIQKLKDNIAGIPAKLTELQASWATNWKDIASNFEGITTTVQPTLMAVAKGMGDAKTNAEGLPEKINALALAFGSLATNMRETKTLLGEATGGFPAFDANVVKSIAIATPFGGLLASFSFGLALFNSLMSSAGGITSWFGQVIDLVTLKIQGFSNVWSNLNAIGTLLLNGDWIGAIRLINTTINDTITNIKATESSWMDFLATPIIGAIDAISAVLTSFGLDMSGIQYSVRTAFEDIKSFLGDWSVPNPFAALVSFIDEMEAKVNSLKTLLGIPIEVAAPNINYTPGTSGSPFDLPKIPGKATGDKDFAGGLAIVGEKGPELVNLPKGTEIIPNGLTEQLLRLGIPGFAGGTPGVRAGLPGARPSTKGVVGTVAPTALTSFDAFNKGIKEATAAMGAMDKMLGPLANSFGSMAPAMNYGTKAASDNAAATTDATTATKDWTSELKSALQQIPGLFNTSAVTDLDMKKAAAGMDVNYADNYVRRAKDEMLNGVDYAEIDPAEVAASVGLSLEVPYDVILAELEKQWNSGAYFANPENLAKLDWGAVKAGLQETLNAELGNANLMAEALKNGMTPESWASMNGQIAQVTKDGLPQAFKDAGAGEALAGGLNAAATTDTVIQLWNSLGQSLWIHIQKGLEEAAANSTLPTPPLDGTTKPPAGAGSLNLTDKDTGKPLGGATPYASGTNYAKGGLSLVGELGPELVNLRRGSQVINTQEIVNILRAAQAANNYADQPNEPGVVINAVINRDMDLEKVAWKVQQIKQRKHR